MQEQIEVFFGYAVRGGYAWKQFINTSKTYYPKHREIVLLNKYADLLIQDMAHIKHAVDLGPGSYEAVKKKTIPILNALEAEQYTAFDLCQANLRDAKLAIKYCNQSVRDLELRCVDFYSPAHAVIEKHPALFLMTGLTILNLPVHLTDSFTALVHNLSRISNMMRSGDYLVCSIDTTTDPEKAISAYHDEWLSTHSLSLIHRMKRDLCINGNLSADHWIYRPAWNRKAKCVDHNLIALSNQSFSIGDQQIAVQKGQAITVDASYKISPAEMIFAAHKSGMRMVELMQDKESGICLIMIAKI